MQRTQPFLLAMVVLAVCWFGMLALHEMGHICGAILTGGTVEKVVLYPLTVSSTTVSPNPHPLIVVWSGPLAGVLIPLILAACCRAPRAATARSVQPLAIFFAGYCLIANGAYIGVGSLHQIGDCREMANHGTPIWLMVGFGLIAVTLGLYLWHGLGTIQNFFDRQQPVDNRSLVWLSTMLVLILIVEFLFSPR